MVKHSFKTLIAAFMALTLFSCAEDKSDSNKEIQERILNAYVNTADFKAKYPNAEFWESGIVMLEYTQGTGETLDTREAGYFEYTTQSLSGEYLLTTDEEIARMKWLAGLYLDQIITDDMTELEKVQDSLRWDTTQLS